MSTGGGCGASSSNREPVSLQSETGDVAAFDPELAFSWESFLQGAPLIPSSNCDEPTRLKNLGFVL